MLDCPREKPLVRSRIEALLKKNVENGCTSGEAAVALSKARDLAAQYGFAPDEFQWPVVASDRTGEPTSRPVAPEPPRSSAASRGRGIGRLAEQLIVEHPEWTYAAIAAEVNRKIDGAGATDKSVRWYSNAMRRRGVEGTKRSKQITRDR